MEVSVSLLTEMLNALAALPYNQGVPGTNGRCTGEVVHELRALLAAGVSPVSLGGTVVVPAVDSTDA